MYDNYAFDIRGRLSCFPGSYFTLPLVYAPSRLPRQGPTHQSSARSQPETHGMLRPGKRPCEPVRRAEVHRNDSVGLPVLCPPSLGRLTQWRQSSGRRPRTTCSDWGNVGAALARQGQLRRSAAKGPRTGHPRTAAAWTQAAPPETSILHQSMAAATSGKLPRPITLVTWEPSRPVSRGAPKVRM